MQPTDNIAIQADIQTARARDFGVSLARDSLLSTTESLLDPLVLIGTLWGIAHWVDQGITPAYLMLALMLFAVSYPGKARLHLTSRAAISDILLNWIIIGSLLLLFGYATDYLYLFSLPAIMLWSVLTPAFQVTTIFALRVASPYLLKLQGPAKRTVIVGINEQALALANRLTSNRYIAAELLGFFDDRQSERLPSTDGEAPVLGNINDVARFVHWHHINAIYLSLPVLSQERITQLLDDLKDTTASVYFVPDIFQIDLIQGHVSHVDGIPVVALCETPFRGFNGLVKRLMDMMLSALILLMISPLMIAVALGVKLSSPGPVIFKQRRYGLYGEEILVYKFRSMTVCEDGTRVTQAKKQDQRITPLGAFIRKTSLDELPQFINVLQGRMSIVGPRPHAVAHNEMYRKLIRGYMVRHKVKPGITGWAQVNGLRGETETLGKMKARIDYDIDYLRHWSPKLDLYIILKTAFLMLKGQDGAY